MATFGQTFGLVTPYEDYAGFFLKCFEQGTTTPISMATDSTGGTLLAKAEVSSGGTVPIGFFQTAGSVIFNPHLEEAYDAWLFPTEAEADANNTDNAIQIADNLTTPNTAVGDLQVEIDAVEAEIDSFRIDTFALAVAGTWTGFDDLETISFADNTTNTPSGGAKFYRTGGTGAASTSDLANGVFFDSTGAEFGMVVGEHVSDLQMGAVVSNTVDSLEARQFAVDFGGTNNILTILSAGTFQDGQLSVLNQQPVIDLANRNNPTRVPLTFTGTALLLQNGNPIDYRGGWYSHKDEAGAFNDIVGTRTGIGLHVFAPVGSSTNPTMYNTGFEGFAEGGRFQRCFNSDYYSLTFKRSDITYNMVNDTNHSVRFWGCRSNLIVGQHVVGDPTSTGVGLDTSGGTWVECEWENSTIFPAFHVKNGSNAFYKFQGGYTEDLDDTAAVTQDFMLIKMDISGQWHMNDIAISSSLKNSARIMLGRANAGPAAWDVVFSSCTLGSDRSTNVDIDIDIDTTTRPLDHLSVDTSNKWVNQNAASRTVLLTSEADNPSMVFERKPFRLNPVRINLDGADDDTFLINEGDGNLRIANGDVGNWEKGHKVFDEGTSRYHLWVDSSGRLRIKSGAPTSSTDGTVVGTQT